MVKLKRRKLTSFEVGLQQGFRSGLEEKIADELEALGIPVEYETLKIKYTRPEKASTYTPDFVLPNGIIIETKGQFVAADRMKHLLIQQQRPDLDIRFIFSNSRQKLSKTSGTSYGSWSTRHGFKYADRSIPIEWLEE